MEKLLKIQMELKAPKWQYNNFGKYKYRSAEDILEAVKPLLEKNKCTITLSDEMIVLGGWDAIMYKEVNQKGAEVSRFHENTRFYIKATATLYDLESDKSITVHWYAREEWVKSGMDWSQITGASSSYARKYALNWLFLIDDTKDSDFTNTHGKEEKKETKPKMTKEIFEKAIEHMKTLDRVQRIDTMSQTSLKYDMTEKQYAELKELSESIPFNL